MRRGAFNPPFFKPYSMSLTPSFSFGSNYTSVQGFVAPNIVEKELQAYDVVTYGATNTYPQEVEYALSRSSIASACVKTVTEFLYGEGFEDDFTARAIVNDKGETLDEVLHQACQQFAEYNGFALLLNANTLGEYTSIECFPFSYVRLGRPDEDGRLSHARVWDNWANESPRVYTSVNEIYSIPLFNPATVADEIAECESIEDYQGQLMYFTANGGFYPACSFDSSFEQVLATGNIPVFANNYIRNGFSNSCIIARKDVLSTEEERYANRAQFKELGGIRNAGKIGVVEGDFEILDISSTQGLDKQYVEIHERLKQDIVEQFQIPPVLLGRTRQGGFPNQDEMRDAYTFFNSKTRMYRRMISKQFAEIGANFVYDVGSNFAIQESKFV